MASPARPVHPARLVCSVRPDCRAAAAPLRGREEEVRGRVMRVARRLQIRVLHARHQPEVGVVVVLVRGGGPRRRRPRRAAVVSGRLVVRHERQVRRRRQLARLPDALPPASRGSALHQRRRFGRTRRWSLGPVGRRVPHRPASEASQCTKLGFGRLLN